MSLSPPISSNSRPPRTWLENPGLTAQLTSLLGTPIEYGLKKLPRKVNEKLGSVIEGALLKVARSATATLRGKRQRSTSGEPFASALAPPFPVASALFGRWRCWSRCRSPPASSSVPSPTSRAGGESIKDMDTLMACIEVFALGGKSASDDASESGCYAVAYGAGPAGLARRLPISSARTPA